MAAALLATLGLERLDKSARQSPPSLQHLDHLQHPPPLSPLPALLPSSSSAYSNSSSVNTLSHPQPRVFPPPLSPRSYTILKEVGDGSFGTVWLADWHSPLELPPGTLPPGPSSRAEYRNKNLVAIKKMKKSFVGGWDECLKLRELKSLQQLPMHANIIPLYDAFLSSETQELYFVFEVMEGNLYQLSKSRKGRPLASGLIAAIFRQTLLGLQHIHSNGYFHRDMKPENLLITTTGLADYPASSLYALPGTVPERDVVVVVKIADFGLARESGSPGPYTEYVSTRWYRSPEILLRSRDYSNPVDLWALGTIMVEVITLKPLFPGDSEVDQVYKICDILGDPSSEYGFDETGRMRGGGPWPRGVKMAKSVGFAFPKLQPRALASLFDSSTVPLQLVDCISQLLRFEPSTRMTTRQCLDHEYFRVAARFAAYSSDPQHSSTSLYTPSLSLSAKDSRYASSDSSSLRSLRASESLAHYPGSNSPAVAQSSPASVWSASQANPDWGVLPAEYAPGEDRAVPSWGGAALARRPSYSGSVAASTFYDGSIFEGIAPSRASSIMSFPTGLRDSSSIHHGSYQQSNGRRQIASAASGPSVRQVHQDYLEQQQQLQQQQQQQLQQQQLQQQQQQQQRQSLPVPTTKSRSWSLGSVFSTGTAPPPPLPSTSRSPDRKHSLAALVAPTPGDESYPVPLDPKKAKKEAEKRAKEAEKARREALSILSRERARAVMRKNALLNEAADPMNNAMPNAVADGGYRKVRTLSGAAAGAAAGGPGGAKGKLPQIVESGQRLAPVDQRFKLRRRDDDDDVHSISSNDTGHSSNRGRPYSVSSQATSSSEPDVRQIQRRLVSPHLSYRAPNTGHSSLDHQFINDMNSLATEPAWSEAMEHRQFRRSTSPRAESSIDPRYNPYAAHRPNSGLHLPPLDTVRRGSLQQQHSSSASVQSLRWDEGPSSTPTSPLPLSLLSLMDTDNPAYTAQQQEQHQLQLQQQQQQLAAQLYHQQQQQHQQP